MPRYNEDAATQGFAFVGKLGIKPVAPESTRREDSSPVEPAISAPILPLPPPIAEELAHSRLEVGQAPAGHPGCRHRHTRRLRPRPKIVRGLLRQAGAERARKMSQQLRLSK